MILIIAAIGILIAIEISYGIKEKTEKEKEEIKDLKEKIKELENKNTPE